VRPGLVPTFDVTCPVCCRPSQVAGFDPPPDVAFGTPAEVATPELRGFVMACGCQVPAEEWTLHVHLNQERAWFEPGTAGCVEPAP
jgi:hypothetical protein